MREDVPLGQFEFASYLESRPRPLLRTEASIAVERLQAQLSLPSSAQISLNLALLGDYRHAKVLAGQVLADGPNWSIEPSPEKFSGRLRAARFTVVIGQARAMGAVPALVLLAALVRRAGP